jgi:rubrerythrin
MASATKLCLLTKFLNQSILSKKMVEKKFWRCTVCSDIHYGVAPPEICPTCKVKNAYVEIEEKEAKMVMGLG